MDSGRRLLKTRQRKTSQPAQEGNLPDHLLPQVSFIITAYNEEQRMAGKIENALEQIYPKEKLEIIVASDASTDQTDDIVRQYSNQGLRLVRAPERKGKEHAQMHAVRAAAGDILVFSDAATILKPDALRRIAVNFHDPDIGCVSSEDRFIDRDGNVSGEGLYVRYEMFIRALESRVNTLVGLSGSFFAARKSVCRNWAPDLQSDFNTVLNAVRMGLKGVSDPQTRGYYENIADERKEFQRKVRTVLRGITVLMRNREFLNPRKHGLFAWQLISHKLFRWLVPFFLIIAFAANIALLSAGPLYIVFFAGQLVFYASALVYSLQAVPAQGKKRANLQASQSQAKEKFPALETLKKIFLRLSGIAYYFTSVNASILIAWFKFAAGKRATTWEPSKR
nr:glycosyltransferase family 2 protein [Desulfosalsimonas propionicica]